MILNFSKTKNEILKDMTLSTIFSVYFLVFLIYTFAGTYLFTQRNLTSISYLVPIALVLFNYLKRHYSIYTESYDVLNLTYEITNTHLICKSNCNSFEVMLKNIKKIKKQRYFTYIKCSRNSPIRGFRIFKIAYNREEQEAFISALEQAVLNASTSVSSNDSNLDKDYLFTIQSNFYKDFLRNMTKHLSKLYTIIIVLLEISVGLILFDKLVGKTLVVLSVIFLFKPLIDMIYHRNLYGTKSHFYLKEDGLKVSLNTNNFFIKLDELAINKTSDGSVRLRGTKVKSFHLEFHESEVINGSCEKLFSVLKQDKIVLERTKLGFVSLLCLVGFLICLLISPQIGSNAVYLGCLFWLISFICALINLIKKNVFKRLSAISMVINLALLIFLIYSVFLNR